MVGFKFISEIPLLAKVEEEFDFTGLSGGREEGREEEMPVPRRGHM